MQLWPVIKREKISWKMRNCNLVKSFSLILTSALIMPFPMLSVFFIKAIFIPGSRFLIFFISCDFNSLCCYKKVYTVNFDQSGYFFATFVRNGLPLWQVSA